MPKPDILHLVDASQPTWQAWGGKTNHPVCHQKLERNLSSKRLSLSKHFLKCSEDSWGGFMYIIMHTTWYILHTIFPTLIVTCCMTDSLMIYHDHGQVTRLQPHFHRRSYLWILRSHIASRLVAPHGHASDTSATCGLSVVAMVVQLVGYFICLGP